MIQPKKLSPKAFTIFTRYIVMRALACGCWEKWSENSEGEDTDLKVENFIVVHDHVNCPAELFPVSLRVDLKIDV